MKQRLIDATDLVSRVLRVRNKTLTDPVPGFGYAACNAERFKQAMHGGIRKVLHEIETSPTIDAVEVVRCRDCEEYVPWLEGDYVCGRIGSYFGNTKPNDFCSRGVRKMKREVEG